MLNDLAYLANELLKCAGNFSYGEEVDRMKVFQILDKHGLHRYYYKNSQEETEVFVLPEKYDDAVLGNEIWSEVDGHIPFSCLVVY